MTSADELASSFPGGWQFCTTDEAGDVAIGQQKSSSNDVGLLFPYLRAANVRDGILDLRELLQMPFADPDRYRLELGDVLLCEGLGSRDLVGRAAAYHSEPEHLMFQNHLIRFRPYSGVDSDYALLVFRAYQKTGIFASVARGIGISHLGLARFRNLLFPLPPPSIQRELALIGGSIQVNLDLIRDTVQNALSELSGVLAEARNTLILGDGASTWSGRDFGQSPWPLEPAANVVGPESPIVYGIVQPGPEVEGGVPYVRGEDLQDGVILLDQLRHTSSEIAERYARSSLKQGDVLLGIIRNSRVAIVPTELSGGNIARGSALLRPGKGCTPAYLAHWLGSRAAQQWLQARMHGIDMPVLNLEDVRQLPVPLPPLANQMRITGQLDEIAARTQALRQSFHSLADILPDLERDLLQSFAYGRHAAVMSQRIAGDLEDKLSRDLLNSLRTEQSVHVKSHQLYDSVSDRRRGQRDTEEPLREVSTTVPKITGKTTATNVAGMTQALERLNRAVSPEELFSELDLAETAVDSFYAALRDLVKESRVEVIRPDDTSVSLRLRSR